MMMMVGGGVVVIVVVHIWHRQHFSTSNVLLYQSHVLLFLLLLALLGFFPPQVESAQISAVDSLGMYVVVGMPGGQTGKLRLPFPRPAESRKDVKPLIVEMTQAAAGAAAEN